MQIIELLKCALGKDPRCFAACSDGSYPMGLSQLNAMRLADILSDDSNFRSYITIHFVSYNHHSHVRVEFCYPSLMLCCFVFFLAFFVTLICFGILKL